MKSLLLRAGLLALLTIGGAHAQSVPTPAIGRGVVWTPGQWITAWSSKGDTVNGVFTNPTLNNPTISGTVSATGLASLRGGVLIGVGTLSATPYQFQSALNYDPSTGPAATRQTIFNTTLSYAGNTTNVFEGVGSFITINGPGQANGEVNLFHGNGTIALGATSAAGEIYEAKVENFGAVTGAGWVGYLALSWNHSTGTVTSALTGLKFQLTNDNVAAGSVAQYYAIDNEARTGAGTVPTSYGFIRNADASGNIVSLGGAAFGTLTPPAAGTLVRVTGADHTGATFPLDVVADNGAHIFFVDTSGKSYFGTSFPTTIDGNGNIVAPSIGNGASAFKLSGSGQWNANGVVATTMTSLGPVGSHTTIQEWLVVTDAVGTVRYVPAY